MKPVIDIDFTKEEILTMQLWMLGHGIDKSDSPVFKAIYDKLLAALVQLEVMGAK